jgi:hypothetical protein
MAISTHCRFRVLKDIPSFFISTEKIPSPELFHPWIHNLKREDTASQIPRVALKMQIGARE